MYNKTKSNIIGVIAFLSIIFIGLNVSAQTPCDGCPGTIEAGGQISGPTTGFNGFTSESHTYDGVAPDCYLPVDNSLNGHLEGIDNQICNIQTYIDSTVINSVIINNLLDSLLSSLTTIIGDVDTLLREKVGDVAIMSSDTTINVLATLDTTTNEYVFDLTLNKPVALRGFWFTEP